MTRLTAVAASLAVLASASAGGTPAGGDAVVTASFERSLRGWAGYRATVERTKNGVEGRHAARVSARAAARAFSLYAAPRPVAATTAGTLYEARAWIRSDRPGRVVCLLVRELSARSVAAATRSCVVSTRRWARFDPVRHTVRESGRRLGVSVYETRARRGDSFEVDAIVVREVEPRLSPPAPPPGSPPAPPPPPGPPPPPSPPRDVTVAAAGDIAGCDTMGDEATADLVDRLAPDLVVTAGDNAYPDGTPAEFAECYDPTWGRFKAKTRPTPGNHEYHTGAVGYFGYFGDAAGDPAKGYYGFDFGGWHFVALNSNCVHIGGCQAGSPQEQWLRADLAASAAGCTVAYFHHARFSSGARHGSDPRTQALWQALYDAGADIVVSGHDHTYERFAPQTPSGLPDPVRGIREFVVGTGGRSLYPFSATPAPNSEVRYNESFGVLVLTLRRDGYDWRFVPTAGTFTDSGSGSCH